MNHTCRRAGFTLVELMIVVAIIAVVATMAIPRLASGRTAANETAAIGMLRTISAAQNQVQSSSSIDTDSDGSGEFGYFAELAGTFPVRVSAGGVPGAGAVGTDNLDPSVLTAVLGTLIPGAPLVSHSGYLFQVWLPGAIVGAAIPGIAEANGPAGGSTGTFPNSDNCETLWCVYAWPINEGNTGNRAFFINQDGDIMQSQNRGIGAAPIYNGMTAMPAFDAAYSTAGDMGSFIPIGIAAVDGNLWTVVQ